MTRLVEIAATFGTLSVLSIGGANATIPDVSFAVGDTLYKVRLSHSL